jgi:hypothetical protein
MTAQRVTDEAFAAELRRLNGGLYRSLYGDRAHAIAQKAARVARRIRMPLTAAEYERLAEELDAAAAPAARASGVETHGRPS